MWSQQGAGQRSSLIIAVALLAITILYLSRGRISDTPAPGNSEGCVPVVEEKPSCFVELSAGRWELATDGCPATKPGVFRACDNNRTGYPRQWVWDKGGAAASCVPRELRHSLVLQQFRNRRVAFVGDSHLRKLYGYFFSFLEDNKLTVPPTTDEKKHEDYSHFIKNGNVSAEFYWRANVITTVNKLQEWLEFGQPPDVVIMDASAHQAKWARNFTEFKSEVPLLVESVNQYKAKFGPEKAMFWIISPPFKENFTTKFENVTWMYSLKKFNAVLKTAGFMMPDGPVIPIDLYSIAQGCMDWCYRDPTHVSETLNTLLWQIITGSYQRLLTMIAKGEYS